MAAKKIKREVDQYLNLYPKVDKKLLKQKFKYDEDTGRVYRLFRDSWRVTKRVNMHYNSRYVCQFQKELMEVQNIAWLLIYGDWPKEPIAAVDGNLMNTHKDNLVLKSSLQPQLGNYLIKPYTDGVYQVKVWHHPYFYRGSSFKKKLSAEKWARDQLKQYNLYASATQAAAETNSKDDVKETPVLGVYYHKPRNLYMVKVRLKDKFTHYSYEKNIEDAIEAQLRGQKEVDEIWQE
jgi:hypothetical protein